MKKLLVRFARNESGATAIEYGLIAGLVAVVIIGAVTTVGTDVKTVFTTISEKLKPAA
ncbi:Flp family type IVb pilin (plasmid) [Sinorhizobium meliloti]|uniref:Flp family type IVb pilin n=1 Tax=Rhizobium meliloti TaxID=382 RepID=UPI002D7A2502|nr:Flp family type IVb pilin [Sinorhizobium meliloti]WRQ71148.1 Flp family type IVb pilin [Sinorhizobium meliloti]